MHSSARYNLPFQSTLSVRRATTAGLQPSGIVPFQSTLSVRRATFHSFIQRSVLDYFNPRSP